MIDLRHSSEARQVYACSGDVETLVVINFTDVFRAHVLGQSCPITNSFFTSVHRQEDFGHGGNKPS